MQVIIGLGNPGAQYAGTRHSAGMMLVDLLSQKLGADYGWRKHYGSLVYKTPDLILVKTKDVFMNESGRLLQGLPSGELYVAHDDLDVKLGEYKVQRGIGPKVHYGMQSVENALGTKDFWRIRIGVDNRDAANRTPGEEYVLQKFLPPERQTLDQVLEKIASEILKTNS